MGTPIQNLPNIQTGLAVDPAGNVYVANETEGVAQITVYSSPLSAPAQTLASLGHDSANTFCGTGPLAVSADGSSLLAGLNYGGGCDSNAVIAYPFSELTDSDAMLTPALAPFPVPVAPSGISVDTSVGSPNFGDIFASYNNYSESPRRLGVRNSIGRQCHRSAADRRNGHAKSAESLAAVGQRRHGGGFHERGHAPGRRTVCCSWRTRRAAR